MYPSTLASFARYQRPWLDLWLASARLGMEAQAVVGLRLFGMATGAVPAAREAGLMVPEKLGALADANYLIARATLMGRGPSAAEDVVRLYRRRVRANRRRLTRLG